MDKLYINKVQSVNNRQATQKNKEPRTQNKEQTVHEIKQMTNRYTID